MSANPKPGMSRTQKLLFFVTAWLICLMPFLFWWNTWFGRKLSDQQLTEYLHDTKKPRHIQQALVQVGERITRQDATAKQWYPDLVRLAADPVEEVRNTDAWVMGQDTSAAGFHDTLLKMLADPSQMVRGNASLSLVRFGDATGRPQILALLQPAHITSPESGRILDADRPGTAIREGGLIAKLGYNISLHAAIVPVEKAAAARRKHDLAAAFGERGDPHQQVDERLAREHEARERLVHLGWFTTSARARPVMVTVTNEGRRYGACAPRGVLPGYALTTRSPTG